MIPNSRERVDLARSFATTCFPVGRPVVVGIPYADTRKPAVTIRYYQSVASKSSPTRDGSWRGELQPLQALRAFFDRTRGNLPVDLNLCRYLTGWSIGALAQPAKQSSRRFTDSLKALSSVLLHGSHHEPEPHGNAQKSHGEIRNVEC